MFILEALWAFKFHILLASAVLPVAYMAMQHTTLSILGEEDQ